MDKGFGKAFANNLVSRTSCGPCPYASGQRIADLTLADNTMLVNEAEAQYGSSLIFVNTSKGATWMNAIAPHAVLTKLSKDKILPRIMHFNHPAAPHKDRNKLLNALERKGYTEAPKYISDYHTKTPLLLKIKIIVAKLLHRSR